MGDGGLRNSLAVNAAGEAYLAGSSLGIRVATADAVQSVAYCDSHLGNAFLIRINSAGDKVTYGTYLGGTVRDYATAVALDGQGNVYLAGQALSSDFPTTPGTFQPTRVGQAFVAKIDMATKRAVGLQAVMNGASFLGGPLVPGELVTLFGDGLGPDTGLRAEATDGALPTELGSTRVIVDGTPAPLLYVSRNQVNAIVPFATVDMPEVVVCAAAGCSNAVRLSVVPQHI